MFNGFGLPFHPLLLVKIATLIILAIYAVFTFVIYTQVKTMNRIVNQTTTSATLRVIAFINVVLVVSLFVFALAIL